MLRHNTVLCSLALAAGALLHGADDPAGIQFFEQKIRPLLVTHCYECHSAESKKVKGGLTLDTRNGWEKGGDAGAPAVIPGDPEKSLLLRAMRHLDDDLIMPPKKPKLPEAALNDVAVWIKMGAPDPRVGSTEAKRADKSWWSLQRLKSSEPQTNPDTPPAWQTSPIDRFVWQKLAEKSLAPNPPADKRSLYRRLCYDVTGLPPSSPELDAFASDADPFAYEKAVDRLLASPRYGEQWGRHWLDVIRFGESRGYERNEIITNLWPFRDYVIRSINEDKPFNRFIQEHLAGDVLGKDQPDIEIGIAFLTSGPYDDVGNQDAVAAANIRAVTVDDMVTATGTAFLGLTVNCARCHHHKFDPIPTEDYYRIKCAFDGISHGSRALVSREVREQHAALAKPLQDKRDEIGRWKSLHEKSAFTREERELTAALQKAHANAESELKKVPALPTTWLPMIAEPKTKTVVFKGGDPLKPGDFVTPASLAVLDQVAPKYELPANARESERRLALANWITSDANPLTARVLANRVWQYHFGTGLVDTPSDFGFLGGKPSHPELLDWLALRLQQHGWKLKALHREILLSQTYRQSAAYREDGARADKDARLLWRFPPRRLCAEEIRDTYLAVSGKLDLKMGGPGFRLYDYRQDNVATYVPLEKHGPETYRRAVYHHNARASVVDLLSDFDLPDNAFAAPKRSFTTTPLQALTLLNHAFTVDMSRAIAEAVHQKAGSVPETQAAEAFLRVLQRKPSNTELSAAAKLIQSSGLPALCRALLNSNALLYLE